MGYARVDLRTDAAGKLHVLELNANPCFWEGSSFGVACGLAGYNYAAVIDELIAAAERRQRISPNLPPAVRGPTSPRSLVSILPASPRSRHLAAGTSQAEAGKAAASKAEAGVCAIERDRLRGMQNILGGSSAVYASSSAAEPMVVAVEQGRLWCCCTATVPRAAIWSRCRKSSSPLGRALPFPPRRCRWVRTSGLRSSQMFDSRAWWPIDIERFERALGGLGGRPDLSSPAVAALMEDVPSGLAAARGKLVAALDAMERELAVPGAIVLGGFRKGRCCR